MDGFQWSHAPRRREIRRIPAEGVLYVISDLHLGDGTRSDIFLAKDRHLLAFLDKVEAEDATLVVAGDAVDFSQTWGLTPILRAHGKVFSRLTEMAGRGRCLYIYGNHDHDLVLYDDLLRIPVMAGVEVGEEMLILHGYELDPYIGTNLRESEALTRIHHALERVLRTWIRPPIEHFYTRANRFSFWLAHKAVMFSRTKGALLSWLGHEESLIETEKRIRYWAHTQMGDPGCLFEPAMTMIDRAPFRYLVCGHSHLPGIVRNAQGRAYVNTGSWTFNSSTFMRWTAETGPVVQDWLTGKQFDDRLYRPMMRRDFAHKSFEHWWRENYMGMFRYRSGEERRLGVPRKFFQPPDTGPT